jgi:integrase
VFIREGGGRCHPARVTMAFGQAAFAAELPPVWFHDLRHLAASLAYAAGAGIRKIQHLLRHTSHNLTADTYTSATTAGRC